MRLQPPTPERADQEGQCMRRAVDKENCRHTETSSSLYPPRATLVLLVFSFSRLADIQWLISAMQCFSLTVIREVSSWT